MAHTWDQEMMRLHNRIEVLEKENRMLRSMLLDAMGSPTRPSLTAASGKRRRSRSCRSSGRCASISLS
jgi:hypothetical protein